MIGANIGHWLFLIHLGVLFPYSAHKMPSNFICLHSCREKSSGLHSKNKEAVVPASLRLRLDDLPDHRRYALISVVVHHI
jgi:hypothetical protein